MNIKHLSIAAIAVAVCLLSQSVHAQETETSDTSKSPATTKPIKALLVTGGCCHDYDRQKLILTRGISARANVVWTVVHQGGTKGDVAIPLYRDADWAKGYDIIVHNECFAHVGDKEFVDGILKPHQDGTPAILIHCAMHCYRTGDSRWFDFVGLESRSHGPRYSFKAENVAANHPIMQGFGDAFVAPKGELYHAMKVHKTATPLAQANRRQDGEPQVCVWTNDYQGTRVFGTTIGHFNETMVEPKYLDMLTKGLLWATGRDPEDHFKSTTETTDQAIAKLAIEAPLQPIAADAASGNCCGESNLAFGKKVTSKSQQSGHQPSFLTDGLLETRFCPSSAAVDEWVTVDLESPRKVNHLRIHWEQDKGATYRYLVEGSNDNATWQTVVDASKYKKKRGTHTHKNLKAEKFRYLRITFLGTNTGGWGSIWELEASEAPLPELDTVKTGSRGGKASVSEVQTPDGFEVSLYGTPPEVNYPVCITAAATGEVFVGVDEQGSLGKTAGGGKVLRCRDTDGDGVADKINTFAKMDHPRGLIYDNDSLWVLHPPFLSVFRDTDGDGTSDTSEVLIKGISTEEVNKRGADHTTNGIALGIDGWIYIAVGDFGFNNAVAKDGGTLSRRGGGVVRIRPDGTEMEIYAWGQRNIVDVAIDPYMNLFTRDNTNDGGGWDIRVSHVMQTAHYGYPSFYKNFTEESMPPLADYGGGSGCGAMYFHDERWPEDFNNLLLTCDWGRSIVFSHDLPKNGATFDGQQDTFLKLPRPTDICVDGSGRMYVASWKDGGFKYDGPDVGFVAMVTPKSFHPKPVLDVKTATDEQLISELSSPSAVCRQHAQLEFLRRHKDVPATFSRSGTDSGAAKAMRGLNALILNSEAPLYARVAAIFTYKQAMGRNSDAGLKQFATDDSIREFSVRALADRKTSLSEQVDLTDVLGGLSDANPRVQAAALVAIGRLVEAQPLTPTSKISEAAITSLILPLTQYEPIEVKGDAWRSADPARVIPHLAVKALVRMNAVDSCLKAINGPYESGALWALKSMHSEQAVDGLMMAVSKPGKTSTRDAIWTTLIRLYHREGEFTIDSPKWWGTRPDTTGPYYDRKSWQQSDRIAAAIKVALTESDEPLVTHIRAQLQKHLVKLDGIGADELAVMDEPDTAIVVAKADPNNPDQIANMSYADVLARTLKAVEKGSGNAETGKGLFKSQSCINCHTYANGQRPKGPHLVDIGKRYKPTELIESIVEPGKKIAQGFDTWTFVMESGKTYTGFVVLESAETVTIRQTDGLSKELVQDDIDDRVKQEVSMMPKGVVGNLTPQQLADLVAYLQTLR